MPELKQTSPHGQSRILGLGATRGDLIVTNDELAGPIDSSDEWIRQRTGIVTRRRASEGLELIDMARSAALEALEKAQVSGAQVDAVIFATITFPYQTPSAASKLADLIGTKHAPAFDISAACAGYCYGIAQADALIRAGMAKHVLVIGAEKTSDFVNPTDRSISFLLGDGAGAALVGASDRIGISKTVWGTEGENWDKVGMTSSLLELRSGNAEWPTLVQEGQSVFRWAVWEMAKVAKQVLEAAGVVAADLAALVPHQANLRIIDELAKQLELPESVVVAKDIIDTGNTSAASIPLAMHRLLAEGQVKSGGLALQIGFGAGLAFAAQVVELP